MAKLAIANCFVGKFFNFSPWLFLFAFLDLCFSKACEKFYKA